jgi:hypothetical protein
MLAIAVAILIESKGRGPMLYMQERLGKNGRPFMLVKFRSMEVDAEGDWIARWAAAADKRVTKVGAFIRKTRLDELPQLLNVLKGEMGLVGPRPERPAMVDELPRGRLMTVASIDGAVSNNCLRGSSWRASSGGQPPCAFALRAAMSLRFGASPPVGLADGPIAVRSRMAQSL